MQQSSQGINLSSNAFELEPFVSAEKVAEFLDVAKREVLRLTRIGRIPGVPVDPTVKRRTWRYRLSEVDAAMGAAPNRKQPKSYNLAGNPTVRKAS